MRGIVYTGSDVEVTDQLSIGDPGPTEVRVAIGAAGVCHSDLSVINGTIPWKAPSVLGHEGAGVVEAVGSEVRSVKPGDHVVIATLASCGTCREMCIRDSFNDAEATAAAIDAEGWLHTGDVGFLDAGGNLAITDRLKDCLLYTSDTLGSLFELLEERLVTG